MIAETDDSDVVAVEYVFGDDLLAQNRSGTVSYYMYDGLGSTRALTDSTGNVSDEYFYDAFGVELARTGTTENDYLFTGAQYDAGLGNYYLRARYYDQVIGRFTQQDTWMGRNHDPISLNKYLYGHAEAINGVDPSGHMFLIDSLKAVEIIGILAIVSYSSHQVFKSSDRNGSSSLDYSLQHYVNLLSALRKSASTNIPNILSMSNSSDSNVVDISNRSTSSTGSGDPCDEWLDDLIEISLGIRLGGTIDELSRQAFNNQVEDFKQYCPHLKNEINKL